jgi:ABC-2 type transport system ATP-binding protein
LQWQRDLAGKGLLKGLMKSEKKLITALDDISFQIHKGEFVAYAGPNGAGKSTTMKVLAGMLLPNQGNVRVLGLSPQKDRIPLMKRLGVLFGNRTELWWDHPVLQSFEWKRVVWDISDETYKHNLELVTELLDLKSLLKTYVRELSLGQRMRADLAMMLLHSPECILLDEPTLGLDIVAKRRMIDFLKYVNQEKNVTILVTSHDMDDLEEMAQRILMISDGKLAYDGQFSGLYKIAGNLTRITLTMSGVEVPFLDFGRFLEGSHGVYQYEVDLAVHSIEQVLFRLSQIQGIQDIEINRAPIEQVIAELFRSWKK